MRKTSLASLELSAVAWLSKSPLGTAAPANGETLWDSFIKPPDDSRMMMRWWWFGPAVTHEELEREMRVMKEGGIGGFEIQPVYPLALDDPAQGIRTLPYLSDGFLDALRFVNQKAQETGTRLDLTLCSGWPYGDSGVPVTQAAGMLRVVRVLIPNGSDSVAVPSLEAGESLVAAWAVRHDQKQLSGASVQVLADISGPRVQLDGLDQFHAMLFFCSQPDGHASEALGSGR